MNRESGKHRLWVLSRRPGDQGFFGSCTREIARKLCHGARIIVVQGSLPGKFRGQAIRLLMHLKKGDSVLIPTRPSTVMLFASAVSLFRGSSYILFWDAGSMHSDRAVSDRGTNSISAHIKQFFDSWAYKHAARIIAADRELAEVAKKRTVGLEIPISVIEQKNGQVEFSDN